MSLHGRAIYGAIQACRLRAESRPAALIIVCLLAAGCRSTHPPATTPAPELAPASRPAESPAENARRLAAMLSVHAYARWPKESFPPGFDVMPLPAAAEYIRDDKGVLAPSRHRRAIAKLAAYGGDRDEVKQALAILGVRPDYIEEQLFAYRVLQKRRLLSVFEIETIIYNLPRLMALKVEGCPTENLKVIVPDDDLPEAFGLVSITVGKDITALARALDPQNWDECSKFFSPPQRTYLAELDANGQVVINTPIAPGTAYGGVLGKQTLFEHYTCNVAPCDAWFKNMLFVTTSWPPPNTPGSRTYSVIYSLSKWLEGEVAGVSSEIDIDDGGITASEGSMGPVTVTATKTVKFVNPVLTGASAAILQVRTDEAAGELAEIACCPIAAPPGAPTIIEVSPVP
jgi:hypothetical protein